MSEVERHRGILRLIAWLLVVTIGSGVLMATSVFIRYTSDLGDRRLADEFHLRSVLLAQETSRAVNELRGAIGEPHAVEDLAVHRARLGGIGRGVGSLAGIQQQGGRTPYAEAGDRLLKRYARVQDAMHSSDPTVQELERALQGLTFNLFQLERLHTISFQESLEESASRQAARNRNLVVGLIVILVVCGVLAWILVQMVLDRLRAYEQAQEEILERDRRLHHTARMEALGTLVGGVAHDFNNLLGVILGYSSMVLEGTSSEDPRRRSLEQVCKAAERAAHLTGQLLVFSRDEALEMRTIDLNDLIRNLAPMLRRLIREDIEIVYDLGNESHAVVVDSAQMETVIMNLGINAKDAMPNGGTLRISVFSATRETSRSIPDESSAGQYVGIAMEDTGVGMEPEVRERIFDPFFTTKKLGEGTGLGLATVHGIVTKSKGWLTVESRVGRGTRFEIRLPRSADPVGPLSGRADTPHGDVAGSETILLAEDDPQVREMIGDSLEAIGYRVLVAEDGLDALRICEGPEPVHLILTDVVMPRLQGPQLIEKATVLRPGVLTIYMSGYADGGTDGVTVPSGSVFLRKPFELGRLREVVRCVLDGGSCRVHLTVRPQRIASMSLRK